MGSIDLAREAVVAAVRLRSEQGYNPGIGLCPFDLADKIGVSARLVNYPTLEGMYSPSPKATILVNSERPAGRRRYSCGHELGHHIFGHGFKLDEMDESNSSSTSPEEILAQRFSGALLMPKIAIDSAFARRGWSPSTSKPEQFFIIAQELGVGYTTLLFHLELNLQLLSKQSASSMRDYSLPPIRAAVAGFVPSNDVFYVDKNWLKETIDVEVGDILITPEGSTLDGDCATVVTTPKRHIAAIKQGMCFLNLSDGKKIQLRISKRNFVGLARYRFLEEIKDDV